MKKHTLVYAAGSGLVLAAAALLISACSPVPPPVPGQPLTWQQKHQLDLQEAQEMHDRRRQDRPCHPNDCF
jgi:outer membrane biogenesis lipoprotein LolB